MIKRIAILFQILLLLLSPSVTFAQTTSTINLNSTVRYQTIGGWEATAQAGQFEFPNLFAKYKNEVINQAVNDLGINRLRIEAWSGQEDNQDYFTKFLAGQITYDQWKQHWNVPVNDNSDPLTINPAGFQFSFIDHQMDNLALPMKQLLEARGEKLYINICYVDFTITAWEHYQNPEEYAEFVLATYNHLKTKYNLVPDSWEIMLEPDNNTGWDATKVGNVMAASAKRLVANGYTPRFVAPSTVRMSYAAPWFDTIKTIMQQQGVMQYYKELSYHRYWEVSTSNLQAIAQRATTNGIDTAQLEHIDADYNELHEDLKVGRNSSWSQYTLAYPDYPGNTGDGGMYYLVKYPDVNNPNPDLYQVTLGSRAKFLRQYFKYIRKDAVRIDATTTNSSLDPLAFINKDGKYVVVVKAIGAGSFTVNGLTNGTYGIFYTTDQEYNRNLTDVTITNGTVTTSIPTSGVLTIYAKTTGQTPTSTPVCGLPGDLNCSGKVDTADMLMLLGNFGKSGVGDINNSGKVDTADLLILLGNFGK